MASRGTSGGDGGNKVLSGYCPDSQCQAKLFFPAQDSSIECTGCGQRHAIKTLTSVEPVTNPDVALHNMLLNILVGNTKPKKGADSVKVLGLSNYLCKILSPLLTFYGMDKSKKAVSLKDMGRGEMFDCAALGDRAFLLDPEHIDTVGYGRDRTGSMKYLSQTLSAVKQVNGGQDSLIPIHADGDGHCLVHAVSRALVGRELFWHALRENLKKHFRENLDRYKAQFHDFIDANEWELIIEECDPYYIPPSNEPLGLRNIHIFGLANILHRPVVLLDSMKGLQSSGDYSGVFLPGLVPPDKCRGKDGSLNKPICLAWSSSGRNHYVALVAVKGRPLPCLPNWMISKAWGMSDSAIGDYLDFNDNGSCTVGGAKCLSDQYIRSLALAMEEKFKEVYKVNPSLVVDVHQYVYKSTGVVGTRPEDVITETYQAVANKLLHRCLTCDAVSVWRVDQAWFRRGGMLYQLAKSTHGQLVPDKKYSFPLHGLTCSYNPSTNQLVPDMEASKLSHCGWCQGSRMRLLNGDGTINYINGDKTTTRTTSTRCQCGFKHFWDGEEYDNLPDVFPLSLEWDGHVVQDNVVWFHGESDPSHNSNVYDVANQLVQKHYPGEFGSELLVQKVVNTIMRQTATKEKQDPTPLPVAGVPGDGETADSASVDSSWRQDKASKIILTGAKHKTIHKEELTASNTEKKIQKKITEEAAVQQRRRSDQQRLADKGKQSTSARPKSSPPAPVSRSKPPVKTMTSDARKVRVTTSCGKQVTLTLETDATFQWLQNTIAKELGIPAARQKIKYGFPPKELAPPSEESKSEPLPIQHGDRVMVEDLTDHHNTQDAHSGKPDNVWPATKPKQSWTNFQGDIRDHSAEGLLQGLNQMHNNGSSGDSLDMSIASLSLMATLTGRDLWSYVQTMPHLFSVGGLFYEQVQRDLGLSEGKHCTLPSLPGKVFRYNASEGRLELCLEPTGHFPIEPNIEAKVQDSLSSNLASVGAALATGGSGIVVNKPMNTHHQVAFSGQGHTLSGNKENIKMPQDLEPTSHNNRAKSFNEFSHSCQHPESIQEEDGEEMAETPGGQSEEAYRRVGPGYSVVNPAKSNETNKSTDLFDLLAKTCEGTISEEESEDECFQDENSTNQRQGKPDLAMDTNECTDSNVMDT